MSAPFSMLVVDDVPEIGRIFRRVAQRIRVRPIDVTVLVASQEAVDLLATRPFDLVVSDFRMPGPDGIAVLRAAQARYPEGRRVLMTGYSDLPVEAGTLVEAGIHALLRKPFTMSALVEFLHACTSGDPAKLRAYEGGQERNGEVTS